jgi:hypothetical protein
MSGIVAAIREVYGLFVEDGRYTIAILSWVALALFVSRRTAHEPWMAPTFFLGFALLLVGSVWLTSTRGRHR